MCVCALTQFNIGFIGSRNYQSAKGSRKESPACATVLGNLRDFVFIGCPCFEIADRNRPILKSPAKFVSSYDQQSICIERYGKSWGGGDPLL